MLKKCGISPSPSHPHLPALNNLYQSRTGRDFQSLDPGRISFISELLKMYFLLWLQLGIFPRPQQVRMPTRDCSRSSPLSASPSAYFFLTCSLKNVSNGSTKLFIIKFQLCNVPVQTLPSVHFLPSLSSVSLPPTPAYLVFILPPSF